MRNGRFVQDKRKYAVSDRDSNPVFLFLFEFFKNVIEWLETFFFDLVLHPIRILYPWMNHTRQKQHLGIINILVTCVNFTDLFIVWSLSVWEVWLVSVTSLRESCQNPMGVTYEVTMRCCVQVLHEYDCLFLCAHTSELRLQKHNWLCFCLNHNDKTNWQMMVFICLEWRTLCCSVRIMKKESDA